jgi:hypothetical protein
MKAVSNLAQLIYRNWSDAPRCREHDGNRFRRTIEIILERHSIDTHAGAMFFPNRSWWGSVYISYGGKPHHRASRARGVNP